MVKTIKIVNMLFIGLVIMFLLIIIVDVYIILNENHTNNDDIQQEEERIIHYAGGCYISCAFKDRNLSYTKCIDQCDEIFKWKQYIEDK